MNTWVITDPAATVLYGTVEATNEVEAAGRADLGEAQWFAAQDPGRVPLAAHAMESLVDGRWREMAPAGPGVAGDCGGDVQTSEAFGRRFAMARPGGIWAVLDIAWYAVNESVERVEQDTPGEAIEIQEQFQHVDDLHDLDHTLWWNDRYRKERERRYSPTDADAKQAAGDFTVADIEWNGEEFR